MNNIVKQSIIIDLAIEAGKAIMEIYKTDFSEQIEIKSDNSPLTIADKKANDIIMKGLKENYPQISILSEESQEYYDKNNDWCFVVDPLDGTKEFIKKNGEFTVNIGLVYQGAPVLGVVYIPVQEVLYYGKKDQGAFKKNIKTGEETQLKVSDKLDKLIWVGSKSHSSDKEKALIDNHKQVIIDTISRGSSLKGTMVAEGTADIYYRFGFTCEWDTCAMHAIALEAGAHVAQMDGSPLVYNRENHLNDKGFYIVNRKENIWV